jgi:hypothetical protein
MKRREYISTLRVSAVFSISSSSTYLANVSDIYVSITITGSILLLVDY